MQYWQLFIFACVTIVVPPRGGHSESNSFLNCTRELGSVGDVKYYCADPRNEVNVFREGKKVMITCLNVTVPHTNKWAEIIKGINVSGNAQVVNIQGCPVPEKSIKTIFDELSIWGTKILQINTIKWPLGIFQESHFENLQNVTYLEIRDSNLTSLAETVFSGLPSLKTLLLRNIHLLSVSPNLFKPVQNVTFLDLGGNPLATMQADTFKYMPNLKQLNLNGIKFKNITKDLFQPLPHLAQLDLSNNGIVSLPEDVFEYLPSLTLISLNDNNIGTLPETIFNSTKLLKEIKAMRSHNKTLSSIPSGLFSNLVQLENVMMNSNNLTNLPEDMFAMAKNLINVSLNWNSLKQLPGTLFRDSTKVFKIEIHHNKLTFLNETLFHGLESLKLLYLQNNELTSINTTVFNDLSSLQELNLENNRLAYLHPEVFVGLKNLRTIYLNNNRLDMKMPSGYSFLHNCRNIQHIHLSNNTVDDILEDWVLGHVYLETLDLSYNRLEFVNIQRLQFLAANKHKVKLDLRHNRITTINLRGLQNWVKESCLSPTCERNLDITLKGNDMNCDCKLYDFVRYVKRDMTSDAQKYFTIADSEQLKCAAPNHLNDTLLKQVQLSELHCSWNGSSIWNTFTCPAGCSCADFPFKNSTLVINCNNVTNLPKMNGTQFTDVELSLSDNSNLRNMSDALNSSKIVKLSLAYNGLTNIHDLVLPHTLKTLELDHNQISYLDEADIEKLYNTDINTSITLHNNPWRCDCDIRHLLAFVHARHQHIRLAEDMTCEDSGKSIQDYSVDELCNNRLALTIACFSVAVFGVLFGSATILYFLYQHEIKVWMYAHKICLWLVSEKEVDCNKEYDAFVSFSQLDEDFIVKHLIPILENGSHPYKLCLHYRDWVIGDFIPTQIRRSVENSRRTVIVMSPNFVNSEWAKEEFRLAHVQAIKERHERVIIIMLKDLSPTDQIDPELKAYLSEYTYLKWGDPKFWDRLRYALPHGWHKESMASSKTMKIKKDTLRSTKLNVSSCLDLKLEKVISEKKSKKKSWLCFT